MEEKRIELTLRQFVLLSAADAEITRAKAAFDAAARVLIAGTKETEAVPLRVDLYDEGLYLVVAVPEEPKEDDDGDNDRAYFEPVNDSD